MGEGRGGRAVVSKEFRVTVPDSDRGARGVGDLS